MSAATLLLQAKRWWRRWSARWKRFETEVHVEHDPDPPAGVQPKLEWDGLFKRSVDEWNLNPAAAHLHLTSGASAELPGPSGSSGSPAFTILGAPGRPAEVHVRTDRVAAPGSPLAWAPMILAHELGHVALLPRHRELAGRIVLLVGQVVPPSIAAECLNVWSDLLINAILATRGLGVAAYHAQSRDQCGGKTTRLGDVMLDVHCRVTGERPGRHAPKLSVADQGVAAALSGLVFESKRGSKDDVTMTGQALRAAEILRPLLCAESAGMGKTQRGWVGCGLPAGTGDAGGALEEWGKGGEAELEAVLGPGKAGDVGGWLERAAARACGGFEKEALGFTARVNELAERASEAPSARVAELYGHLESLKRGKLEGGLDRLFAGIDVARELAILRAAHWKRLLERLDGRRAGRALELLREQEKGKDMKTILEEALRGDRGTTSLSMCVALAGRLPGLEPDGASKLWYRARLQYEMRLGDIDTKSAAVCSASLWPERWGMSDGVAALDVRMSLGAGGRLIPGFSTVKRHEMEVAVLDAEGSHGGAPALEIFLDSSGSMPNPVVRFSQTVLVSMMVARAAASRGAPIRVVNFSGEGQFRDSGWQPLTQIDCVDDVLLHYFGGGTVFPVGALAAFPPGCVAGRSRILILFTDAEVYNANELLDALKSLSGAVRSRGTGRLILECFVEGAGGGLVSGLEALDAHIHPADPARLRNVVLGLTRSVYRAA